MPALTTAQRIRATVGVAVIFGTWFYLVFTRPTDWESVGGSSPALITLGGYVFGAILLLSASLPILPARTIAIIPRCPGAQHCDRPNCRLRGHPPLP